MMKKIKIIEAGNELGLGGTEYTIQLLSKYLSKDFFDVTVIALHKGGERVAVIRALGIQVVVLNGDYRQLGELLRQTDVFHWHGDGTMPAMLYKTIREHKPQLVIQTNIFGNYDHSPYYQMIDYDLFVSNMILIRRMWYDQQTGINTFQEKRKVLPNPVDIKEIEELMPTDDELVNFKKMHQLENHFIVGRIGRPDNAKFDLITLDAYAKFAQQHPGTKFLLVGFTAKILEHAAALGISDQLILLENTSDLRTLLHYYRSIDIFLAASAMGESFGMVMAEAMAAGIPVVTISTEDKDNAQVEVVDNGNTGLVVQRDVSIMASALDYLYRNDDLRSAYGIAAKQKAKHAFNAQHVAESLANLIFKHFQIPIQFKKGTLISEYSTDKVDSYASRCRHLWQNPDVNPVQ